MNPQLNERIAQFDSPFRRLDELLAPVTPDPAKRPIVDSMTIGALDGSGAMAASNSSRRRNGESNCAMRSFNCGFITFLSRDLRPSPAAI